MLETAHELSGSAFDRLAARFAEAAFIAEAGRQLARARVLALPARGPRLVTSTAPASPPRVSSPRSACAEGPCGPVAGARMLARVSALDADLHQELEHVRAPAVEAPAPM